MLSRLMPARRNVFTLLTLFFLIAHCTFISLAAGRQLRVSNKEFAQLIQRLSEEPGYFDSENLVSNEASYLQVVGKLEKLKAGNGVYLGVGPEQNFTYIARTRPRMAILLDIRKQNMLYHLLFKALFDMSRNRAEYISHLFCKPLPRKYAYSKQADVKDLLSVLEQIGPADSLFQTNWVEIEKRIRTKFQLPLTAAEVKSIQGIYREFFEQQFEIRFRSQGRPTYRFYPSFQEITLETDLEGKWKNYLNSEEDFLFLKKLHAGNLIIPVVGDFAGGKSLRAIGEYLKEKGETVSIFYVSNVEFYLIQNAVLGKYAENLKRLPVTDQSLIIRAYFRFPHPERRPGYISATLLQRIKDFIQLLDAGRYLSYQDLGLLDYLGSE